MMSGNQRFKHQTVEAAISPANPLARKSTTMIEIRTDKPFSRSPARV